MMTYWQLLENIPGSKLRLTKLDDEIHQHFTKDFPEFDPAATLNEEEMKSKEGKEKWRKFITEYEKKVDDYNFGTMLRINPKSEYGEKDTIFGMYNRRQITTMNADFPAVRMQFYAIEIARNKAGLNDWIYEKSHPSDK